MDYVHVYHSFLGNIIMTGDGKNLRGLWFEGNCYFDDKLGKNVAEEDNLPVFYETDHWLDLYFSGDIPDFLPSLLIRRSEYEQKVYSILLKIPYGMTVTYSDIAAKMDHKTSPRAVGRAVGRNPICLLIPCHRVIGKDGSLTGYSGGLERKKALLRLEREGAGK